MLRGSRSKWVALTILFLFVVNACHSQGYSDLVGEWSANSESLGKLGLFLYEDSSMIIVEDENEYSGPAKLHQANGGTVQLHIEEYELKARYQSPSGSTVLWALLDLGESLIELRPLSRENIEFKVLRVSDWDGQTGELTARETPKSTPIIFQRSAGPVSQAYQSFEPGQSPDVLLMGKWNNSSDRADIRNEFDSPSLWRSIEFLSGSKVVLTYKITGKNQVLEYEIVDGRRLILANQFLSYMYTFDLRGGSLTVTYSNGDKAQFVKAN